MVMNISCKFEKASYNIFVRAVTVKSLYTLRTWWIQLEVSLYLVFNGLNNHTITRGVTVPCL